MGLGRMLWRSTGIGRTIDTVKNMVEEGSVIEGVKKTAKEDWCEDNPITSRVYQAGKYDGKVEGYEEASDEYEEKLLKQADEFLKQTHKRKTKESLTCLQVKYILKQIYLKRGYASRGEEVSPERVLSCIEDT